MWALMSSQYDVYVTASDIPGDVLTHIHSLAEDNQKFERNAAVVKAMSKKDQERFEDCYLLALSLLFRPAGDVTKLSGKEIALFTQAGVLTDDACWHYFDAADMPEGCVRVGDIKYRDSNSREVILIASKVGRFRMAQQPLFRMAYGFGVLESAVSWQRYRVVVAEYASIVLAGHKGRKLR
ncbi:unnamed protein product, partial [Bodo saltans]